MTPPNLSLILIMVCFWVTLWLVNRYLVRPVGGVVSERRRRVEGAHQEWTAKNEEYLQGVARVEEALADAAKDSARLRADARQGAMDERQKALDGARARADERLTAALETLDGEADAARDDLRRRAEELSRMLAGRLLGRELRT
jgi:F-type H+-transporting ATPase subunit b